MFDKVTFWGVNIADEEDYEKLLTLSYIDEIKKNVPDMAKEQVIGNIVMIDAEALSLGFISSKAREAIKKGLMVIVKEGL